MTDRVTEYARKVLADEVTIGEYKNVQMGQLHKAACKRHLQDLERQNTPEFPFWWDREASDRIIKFAESLTIVEGDQPKPLKLHDFQAFDLGVVFGWKKANGKRRFRRKYKSIARQNGKSMENGVQGTYILGFSGYQYGQLYTAATKRRQARIAWNEMRKFIVAEPDLAEMFKIKEYANTIECLHTHCTMEALSKEGGIDDGFRPIYASVDEVHQMKDNSVYKALYNGTKTLAETLVSMITTRGKILNGFCREMDDYAKKILNGTATAEDFFVDIYCLDDDDDIWEESNWIKANPFIFSDPEKVETFRTDARTAQDMGGSDQVDFVIKSLNMWPRRTENTFIDPVKWAEAASDRSLSDFAGSKCWVGLDLSSGGDLTTFSIELETPDGKNFIHSHSFMPRGRLEEHIQTDVAPYDLWEQKELLTVTGGCGDFKNDYSFILTELARLKTDHNLEFAAIGVDPHNFDGIRQELEKFGCDVVVVTQSARSLNDATVDMQLLCKSGQLEYNKANELLSWSFLNAQTVDNSFGEKKVDKMPGRMNQRIDPVDAAIDAHFVHMKSNTETIDVSGALDSFLEVMGW